MERRIRIPHDRHTHIVPIHVRVANLVNGDEGQLFLALLSESSSSLKDTG